VTIPVLNLSLHGARADYEPGETLAGTYQIVAPVGGEPQAMEISVLWSTEGKGDEDMAVHFFERVSAEGAVPVDFSQPREFSTVLPNSPLSYDGVIVKIHWCARVRAFLPRGKQLVEERLFRLGTIPAARAVLP
jgi:hypothetical protein